MAKGVMKYFDEATQSWVPLPSAGNGSGGNTTRTALWSGSAGARSEITLTDDPAGYDLITVRASSGRSGSYAKGVLLIGGLVESDYYGDSIAVSGIVMGSGGFPYAFVASITRVDGNTFKVSEAKSWLKYTDSSTEIIGYKCG